MKKNIVKVALKNTTTLIGTRNELLAKSESYRNLIKIKDNVV